MRHLALTLAGATLFLAATLASAAPFAYFVTPGGNLLVVDTATDTLAKTVAIGSNPFAAAVNKAGTRVYATNFGGNSVSVIDTSTHSVIATIPVAAGPQGVAVNPAGTRVYVANFSAVGFVTVIDAATNTVITSIPMPTGATDVVVDPTGTRLYVTGNGIYVVDTNTNTYTGTIPISGAIIGMAVAPTAARLYVRNITNATVVVIDTSTSSVVGSIPVPTPFTYNGLALNATGTQLYVSNGTTVSVIDPATNTVTGSIPLGTAASAINGVDVTPDDARVYGATTSGVVRIDTATNAVTNILPTSVRALGHFVGPNKFTVTNTNDSGPGSLRDAVAQANAHPGADTIDFAVTGTITLTSGTIWITSGPLTISGPGAANLAIDGNNLLRIFLADNTSGVVCPVAAPADYQISMSGLTLRNGNRKQTDSQGAAIFSSKSLMLDSMVFSNNVARAGGAVAFSPQIAGQSLTITNSQFTNNKSMPTVVGNVLSYVGGALLVADYCFGNQIPATVTIADSTFSGNRVQPDTLEGRGGAMAIFSNSTVSITRTAVINNGIDPPSPLGAFSYSGGGILASTKDLTITDSEISDNYAQGSAGIRVNGDDAALQTPAATRTFKLVNSTVARNVAYNNAAGILLWANVASEIINSTVADNLNLNAASGSGGVLLSKPATGTYLDPTLSLISSVLGQAGADKGDLSTNVAVLPATTVNATNSLIQRVCSTCGLTVTGTGNIIGASPQLAALSFNGGNSRTMAPLAGSPVIDTGSNPLGLATDQRGPGFPRTVGAATDMGALEGPAYCAGFTDVTSANTFCPNVEWLKNRAITLGCTSTSVYCPTDPVTRLSMAVFMNRLGGALTPQKQLVQETPGALVLPLAAPLPRICATTDFAPAAYPRTAVVNATISGLADGNAVAWRGFLAYSTDGGATWLVTPTQTATRSYGAAGQWSNAAPVTAFQMAPGLSYRFATGVQRDNLIAGTTGNFAQSTCQLNAVILNRNGTNSPFDTAAVRGGSVM